MHITPQTGRRLARARKMKEMRLSVTTNPDNRPLSNFEKVAKASQKAVLDPAADRSGKVVVLDHFRPK